MSRPQAKASYLGSRLEGSKLCGGRKRCVVNKSAKENSNSDSNQNEQYETCQYQSQPSVSCSAARCFQKCFNVSVSFPLGVLLIEPLNSQLLFPFPVIALFDVLADSFCAFLLKFRF